ncbi:3-hydroxy-3-methylglutaryl-coenzyme A reductase [Zea mays]|uniref:hydroxymethylglutaryl-CoA reductase (NADPH) n=2 Tax=Zea mays TaxID=4577 RepID=B8A391_MAIZE|nr:3-hydroxy-3-methylglutaryl-coenzyme A reductase [Zea mays]ACL54640.1 unknown [Zea mays]|eukprot:NP_001146733.1 3-hydroxy-3-methylglutaryl-coenzyme A reductase [Zea mays]
MEVRGGVGQGSAARHPPAPEPSRAAARVQAGDALPLPIRHTNLIFSALFAASLAYLMRRWREKIRSSTPLHAVGLAEMLAIFGLVASLIYLLSFFGIAFVQSIVSSGDDDEDFLVGSGAPASAAAPSRQHAQAPAPCELLGSPAAAPEKMPEDDEEIVASVVAGKVPSYALEARLGDCRRAAGIRREALRRITGRDIEGLPLDGFDYASILGQCCELPVGYVQLPVGVAGPLLLDGRRFYLPMATTEGCLVASTNRGCKAIAESGGATSVVLRDAMTRAPVARFPTARRAAELKAFLEDPANFDTLSVVFNRSSRFARLQGVQCAMAGRNLYMRFSCSTGDAMGMNMVSKGVQNVLDFLQDDFHDMDVISISGSSCSLGFWQLLLRQEAVRRELDRGAREVRGVRGRDRGGSGEEGPEDRRAIAGRAEHDQEPRRLGRRRRAGGVQRPREQHRYSHLHRHRPGPRAERGELPLHHDAGARQRRERSPHFRHHAFYRGGHSRGRDSAGVAVRLPGPPGREGREPGPSRVEREAAGHRGRRRGPRRRALPAVGARRGAAREEPHEVQQVEQGRLVHDGHREDAST